MKFTPRTKSASTGTDSSLYIRLKDGESINIIPRGEIYEFYSVFGTRGEVSADTAGAKLRFKVNVVINDSGTLRAKVLEFGMTVYEQLAEINKVCDVSKTKIRFSRRGSTKSDTIYIFMPVVNEPLSPKLLATIDANPLNILDGKKPEALPSMPTSHDFPPESYADESQGPSDLPF